MAMPSLELQITSAEYSSFSRLLIIPLKMTRVADTDSSAQCIAIAAKEAFNASQLIPVSERTRALAAIKHELAASKLEILQANKKDMEVSCSPVTPVSSKPLFHSKGSPK
jgi:hypothetical protein